MSGQKFSCEWSLNQITTGNVVIYSMSHTRPNIGSSPSSSGVWGRNSVYTRHPQASSSFFSTSNISEVIIKRNDTKGGRWNVSQHSWESSNETSSIRVAPAVSLPGLYYLNIENALTSRRLGRDFTSLPTTPPIFLQPLWNPSKHEKMCTFCSHTWWWGYLSYLCLQTGLQGPSSLLPRHNNGYNPKLFLKVSGVFCRSSSQ